MQVGPPAEAAGEAEISGGRELLLAAEQQQGALDDGGANDRDHLGVMVIAKIDAVDPRADMLREVRDLEAASSGSRAPVLLHDRLLDGTDIAAI